jgi:hypothetical protein
MATVNKPDRKTCLAFSRPESHSQRLLQSIANLKVVASLAGDSNPKSDKAIYSAEVVPALEKSLSEVTGKDFRFDMTPYPHPTLLVRWGGTRLSFDLLPDGLRSIIGWMVDAVVTMDAWLGGTKDIRNTEAVFLLDELESHLHPIWQRRILPAFQSLFPKAQMFVATHSPFVISSLNEGWIHAFAFDPKGEVKVNPPQPAKKGDSYITVLEDIMGLKEWYDPETEKLLSDFRSQRDRAYGGDQSSKQIAVQLAQQIGKRSLELDYMMGKELAQMERQLAGK